MINIQHPLIKLNQDIDHIKSTPVIKRKDFVKRTLLRFNMLRSSYNYRFLKSKRRRLYFKTIKQQHRFFVENIEKMYDAYLTRNILKIEKRETNKRKRMGIFTLVVPMAYRAYSYTKVYVTHCVKNTFITIFRGQKSDLNVINHFNFAVLNKLSCGLLGYKGPKKATVYVRKEVIKEAGYYLGANSTSLMSVIFTSVIGRWNRKTVRNLSPNLSYILSIFINYKRSHGYKKLKNQRRT